MKGSDCDTRGLPNPMLRYRGTLLGAEIPDLIFLSFKFARDVLALHKTSICVLEMIHGLELDFSRYRLWFFTLDMQKVTRHCIFIRKVITFISVFNLKNTNQIWSNVRFLKFKIFFLTDFFRMGLIFDSYNSDVFINTVQNT